jgi:hypothetical protein
MESSAALLDPIRTKPNPGGFLAIHTFKTYIKNI